MHEEAKKIVKISYNEEMNLISPTSTFIQGNNVAKNDEIFL